ncbi:MAG TPA: phosphoenolpyruvate carboxylase, partial [Streptosporangiaceae bacterium]|nr:phosphoenolpyruvate carboxylase [Streptosporangiaceae bacterium]
MPEPMRDDVRLLGRLLGDVLRDAGGQDLLDDVEKLRHAVIDARRHPETGSLDDIAAMVAAWPLDRAEQVASAFTVYFHMANLAEELQRIRALRERDTEERPLEESLAAT